MKRELKFRAWRVPEMIYQSESGYHAVAHFFNRVHGQHEVMQFTGLKDKNGKEIYEFDILCFEGRYHYQVVYQDAKFVCLHAAKSNTMAGTLWGALHRFFDPDFFVYGGVEVIGNKFENPELLTP